MRRFDTQRIGAYFIPLFLRFLHWMYGIVPLTESKKAVGEVIEKGRQ